MGINIMAYALAKKYSEQIVDSGGTAEGIKETLGATTAENDGYLSKEDWIVFNSKASVADVSNAVVGLWNDRGNYDASSDTFPSTGGSGNSGAIKRGNTWTISVVGVLGSSVVEVGNVIRALSDNPGQTASNWNILQKNMLKGVANGVAELDADGKVPVSQLPPSSSSDDGEF